MAVFRNANIKQSQLGIVAKYHNQVGFWISSKTLELQQDKQKNAVIMTGTKVPSHE